MNRFKMNQQMFKNNQKHNAGLFELPKIDEPELPYLERQQGWSEVEVFLDEEIKDARYYRNIVQRLYSASENDLVRIYINSHGGDLEGALALIDAIQQTEADVVAIVTGICASAASLIALHCMKIMVSDNARFMVHQSQYGVVDTANVIRTRVSHNDEWFDRVMYDAYRGFLTEEELEEVKNGREFWMFAEEVNERLERRFALLNSEMQNNLEVDEVDCSECDQDCRPKECKKHNANFYDDDEEVQLELDYDKGEYGDNE